MKQFYSLTMFFLWSFFSIYKINAATYYSKSTGGINTLATWGTNTNGTGTAPTNFTTAGDVFIVTNRTSVNLTANWNLGSSVNVTIGDGVSAITFSITGSGRIANATVNAANTATVVIAKASNYITGSLGTLHTGSTFIYTAASAQLKVGTYGNLTLSASNALLQGETFVFSILNINSSATLNLNNQILDINGTITGSGSIISDDLSGIYVASGTSGNIGTITFSGATPVLNFLDISCSDATSYLTLGSNLTIQDNASPIGSYFALSTGGINLNGKTLTIESSSDANFPSNPGDGFITGSSSSVLLINSTISGLGGGNTLYMDQTSSSTRTLKVLGLNNAGATLVISDNLEITDSLSVLDGTLDANGLVTLKSTNTLKGRLGRVGGTISNNIKVETFAKSGSTGWALLGPSGVSGLTVASWEGQISMSCYSCPNDENSAGGSHFVSIQGWDETAAGNAAYVEMSYTDPLNVASGYWTYLGSGLSTTNDITWTVTGPAVQGDVPVGLTNSAQSGYNLVSNPYASPISWDAVYASNSNGLNVNNAIYVYNPDLGTTASYASGVAVPSGITGINNGIIPMGQGFYVEAIGTTLTFSENNKSTSNTSSNPLLKTVNNNTVGDVVRLGVQGPNADYDETAIRFHANATKNFDGPLDARKIFETPGYVGYPGPYNHYTTISTKTLHKDYAINSLPPVQSENVTIPVLVRVMATGQYTLSPIDLQHLPANVCVSLKDKLLNVDHDLRTGTYVCTINDTTSAPRFELTVCANVVASLSEKELNETVIIGQDIDGGIFLKTSFEKEQQFTVSAYNVMGQKIMDDQEIIGTQHIVYLNFKETPSQIAIIKVTSGASQTTKKVFLK